MAAKLLYRDGAGKDASVDVVPDGSFLGRAADCVVRTDDAMVSRKNCKISFSGGRWLVEDLGSSNGTFVNEVRVQKQVLNHADVVRCGTLQVRFVEVADQPMAMAKPRTMSFNTGGAAGVQVDASLSGATGPLDGANLLALKDQELTSTAQERDALASKLRDTAAELEALHAKQESDQGELKKLRQEAILQRDRMKDIERQKSMQDDELHAQTKVAEELRQELAALKDEHHSLKGRSDEVSDELMARDRQLERAQEDVQRTKQATDELRSKLAAIEKTKDDGVRAMNQTVAELEHLREVINEQERILEERRVGMMSLEASTKDLRADKEKVLRETISLKSERDDLRDKVIKLNAHIEAVDEEHRRLVRAMSEGGGGASLASDEQQRVANELREMKIEFKKLEADKLRVTQQLALAENDRQQLADRVAKADVEQSQLLDEKASAEAAKVRASDALAKAETARQRLDEDKQTLTKERDAARASSDELRKKAAELDDELHRLKAQAQSAAAPSAGGGEELAKARADLTAAQAELKKAQAEVKRLDGELQAARLADEETTSVGGASEARIHELESELTKLGAELAVAKSAHTNGAAASGGADVHELKRRAEEAYTGINDALSELRTNILLAKDTLAEHHGAPTGDASKTLTEAIEISVERMEDAKGLLRQLREVIES